MDWQHRIFELAKTPSTREKVQDLSVSEQTEGASLPFARISPQLMHPNRYLRHLPVYDLPIHTASSNWTCLLKAYLVQTHTFLRNHTGSSQAAPESLVSHLNL